MLRIISKMRDGKVSQQLEQEEDALSFSDLIYSSTPHDSSFNEDLHSRSSFSSCHHYDNDDDDDLFEFFNGDFSGSSFEVDNRNIIFCGKMIPQRKPSLSADQAHGILQRKSSDHKSPQRSKDRKNCWFLNHGRRLSLSRTKSDDDSRRKANWRRDAIKKSLPKMENCSKLAPNSSRWNWLRLGSMKVQSEMALDEIRIRQSRQTPKALFRKFDGDGDDSHEEMKQQLKRSRSGAIGSSNSRSHRLIAVVRAISCISSI